jgi:hypothetical protein
LEFEIVDKRRQKKDAELNSEHASENLETEVSSKDVETGSKDSWKSVSYCLQVSPLFTKNGQSGGALILGTAVGLRGDGKPFVANYALPQPTWPEGFNWEKKAKERLDTFLGCECDYGIPCAVHKMYLPQWQQADDQRLRLESTKPVPEAIEAMFKAESALRKSPIKIPRG